MQKWVRSEKRGDKRERWQGGGSMLRKGGRKGKRSSEDEDGSRWKCSAGVKIKMRKFVGDSGMQGGEGGGMEGVGGESEKELKKENEVVHYRLWSPLLPLSAHYFCYLQRKDISLFLGGGVCVRVCVCVCVYVCARKRKIGWGLVYYNY